MVATLALGASAERRVGSNPIRATSDLVVCTATRKIQAVGILLFGSLGDYLAVLTVIVLNTLSHRVLRRDFPFGSAINK